MALAEFEDSPRRLDRYPWGGPCLLDGDFDRTWDEDEHESDWSDEVREYVTRLSRDAERQREAAEVNEPASAGSSSAGSFAGGALPLERFYELAQIWSRETNGVPFVVTRVTHWAYQQIIGMGPAVLPLIFNEMARETDHWFWALNAITGVDPAEGVTNFEDAAARWLDWALVNGFLRDPAHGDH